MTERAAGAAGAPPGSRQSLAVLFGVVIVDLVGFGVVMPILPFWAREHGASPTLLGLVFTAYAAAQFVCAPLWGRLSKLGRRIRWRARPVEPPVPAPPEVPES